MLDLSLNQITAFHVGSFKDLQNLETLLLDGNRIVYILKDTFAGLDNLKKLGMSENKVTFINVKAFRHMRRLELEQSAELRLEKNPIERVRIIDGIVYFD